MGKVFAHTLAFSISEADLTAVADPNEQTAAEAAARYGIKSWFSDYRALLEQKDIEAVVIAASTYTHVEIVKAAAAAGKQIFCEKPLAMTLQGCDEAIAAVEDVAEAQDVDLGLDLLGPPSQSICKRVGVQRGVGISVEEDEDVPRQQRFDVALNELYDRGSKNPFEVVHAFGSPSSAPTAMHPPYGDLPATQCWLLLGQLAVEL